MASGIASSQRGLGGIRQIRPGRSARAPCSAAAECSPLQSTHPQGRPSAAATRRASDVLPTPGGPSRQSNEDGTPGFASRTAA